MAKQKLINKRVSIVISAFLLMLGKLGAQLPQQQAAEWVSKTIIPVRLAQNDTGELIIEDGRKTYVYDGSAFKSWNSSLSPDLELEEFINSNPDIPFISKPLAMTTAPDGMKWISLENKGIYVIDGPGLKQLDFPNFTEVNLGRQVIALKTYGDSVLIGTKSNGLYSWDSKQREMSRIFLSRDFTHTIYDILKDNWGNIWVACDKGLLVKRAQDWKNQVPVVYIDSIRLQEGAFATRLLDLETNASIQLKPNENNLEFFFSAAHLLSGESLKFQTRLSPVQSQWQQANNKGLVQISNLRPGNYSFEVKAFVGTTYAAFAQSPKIHIHKPAPVYIWWYLLGGFLLIGVIWFTAFRRSQVFIKNLKEEKEKLQTEKTLLQFQHKALQLQMNPHFIFNAFNSIQGLIAENRNRDARKYLNKFAQLMRSTLKHSTEDWIQLEDEIESLKAYLEIEQLCKPGSFQYKIIMDKDLESEEIRIPPMVLQPFLENAIKHGFKSSEKDGELTLQFKEESKYIKCLVDDNGIGLIASKAKKPQNNHQSLAIQLIRERLVRLTHLENPLNISEKFADDGTSLGTRVILYLPYK